VGSAVNRQGTGLAAALGGGASVAPDGTVTAPAYAVAGGTQNNVGAALSALDGAVTGLTNGTSGLVQQTGGAPGTGPITIGAATGGTLVNVAGADGNRTVTGVAAGALTAASTDSVNGSQVNRVAASVASGLGGGATFDPATGQVTAPSYAVGGVAYNNVGGALAAQSRLGVQYVPDAAGNPTNAVRLSGSGNGQPVSVTNLANGALSATSSDAVNGAQLFAVQQVAANAVQYDANADSTPGRSAVTFGTPGTPVQLKNVAPGIRPTDAANLGQLQAGLASGLSSANAYTDGQVAGLRFDLGKVAKHAYAGTASALALQAPALIEPGQVAMRGGVGYYRGEWALGLSLRATADNGKWSLSGGISGGPNSGVAASAGVDISLGD
jgi:autotransporter adhesin